MVNTRVFRWELHVTRALQVFAASPLSNNGLSKIILYHTGLPEQQCKITHIGECNNLFLSI